MTNIPYYFSPRASPSSPHPSLGNTPWMSYYIQLHLHSCTVLQIGRGAIHCMLFLFLLWRQKISLSFSLPSFIQEGKLKDLFLKIRWKHWPIWTLRNRAHKCYIEKCASSSKMSAFCGEVNVLSGIDTTNLTTKGLIMYISLDSGCSLSDRLYNQIYAVSAKRGTSCE